MTGAEVAMIISACGTVLTAAGTLITVLRQGALMKSGRARDEKLEEVHALVNGQSEALKTAIGEVAFNAGEKAGIAGEREHPMSRVGSDPPHHKSKEA